MLRVLITGGAGFIGSHVADELLANGYAVTVLDSLREQVHGPSAKRPAYLDDRVDLRVGDVRDKPAVRAALAGADAVIHLAAAVGVGQSMYELEEYTSINTLGTATLLEVIAEKPVARLVVASSMSIYGEGLYRSSDGVLHDAVARTRDQLKARRWEPETRNGSTLGPLPTPEHKTPRLTSVYALSKFDQESLCLLMGRAYGVPTVALRLFNTYGPRQALSNPYTGVLAIFAARFLNGKPPFVFEDGLQRRDFVSVLDVARSFRLALESPRAADRAVNIGSGIPVTVRHVAERLAASTGSALRPEISEKYRVGDIRHCYPDIALARDLLGYEPRVSLDEGLRDLSRWLEGQSARDRVDEARRELDRRGLTL